MDKNYEKIFQQQVLLLERLSGETKRDYYVDLFTASFIQALKFRRKEEKLNQNDIAKLMGVKQSYVSKIENLEKVPTLDTIARYSYALNFQIEELRVLIDELAQKDGSLPDFCKLFVDNNHEFWDDKKATRFRLANVCETLCSI